ncbi:hypothetical protein MUK42_34689 [Musa troglodytarum]|uniref:Uncharacterized protein n=1 Tax=Musa troglodytarum TaxID=320322 RepID=A0A9E7KMI3_9LILI|nr:hypothetical protein MUK42_34689 [Musa troglodytarum]
MGGLLCSAVAELLKTSCQATRYCWGCFFVMVRRAMSFIECHNVGHAYHFFHIGSYVSAGFMLVSGSFLIALVGPAGLLGTTQS